MIDLNLCLETATVLAKQVGARIREITNSTSHELQITKKGISDLVTEIDIWSENIIGAEIAEKFPDHLFVGEESHAQLLQTTGKTLSEILNGNVCWVIDPLDGTTNFSNKIPYSAVSIAVVDRGQPIVGVVYDPHRDELFSAVKGQGAFMNGQQISASKKDQFINCVVATGFPYDRWENWQLYQPVIQELIMSARNVRSFGAAAIDLAWVACGRFDCFLEFCLKPWDVAAGILIVEEAGGRKFSFEGEGGDEDFSLCSRAFLCSGANIFEEYLEKVKGKYIPSRKN